MFDLVPFGRGSLANTSRDLFDYFNKIDREFFGALDKEYTPCRTDIQDKGDHYLLEAELPGFNKEDIHIDIDNNTLNLHAEHQDNKEEKNKKYIRRERRYGSFCRSFDLSGIDADKINAKYNNGVLELTLPKMKEEPTPPSRQIEIE